MDRVCGTSSRRPRDHDTDQVDVKFAGGEPTLTVGKMERFRSILERMRETGVKLQFSVLSNGTLISDRLISFLKAGDTSISISLDGYGEAHNMFRVFRSDRALGISSLATSTDCAAMGSSRTSWRLSARRPVTACPNW